MPRFYFHIRNDMVVEDEEGRELSCANAARAYAIESARGLACHSIREGHLNLDHYIEVTGEQGEPVLKLTFREAFTIEG